MRVKKMGKNNKCEGDKARDNQPDRPVSLNPFLKAFIFLENILSFVLVGVELLIRLVISLLILNYLPPLGLPINSGLKIILILWVFKPILDEFMVNKK